MNVNTVKQYVAPRVKVVDFISRNGLMQGIYDGSSQEQNGKFFEYVEPDSQEPSTTLTLHSVWDD